MTEKHNPFQSPSAESYDTPESYDTNVLDRQRNHAGWLWILFSFNGRIPRRFYWGGIFAILVVFMVFYVSLMIVFGEDSEAAFVGLIVGAIPLCWSSLALRVKRWHDRDKRGWWILITIIPYIGNVWEFVELGCLRGTKGDNRFGPDPT